MRGLGLGLIGRRGASCLGAAAALALAPAAMAQDGQQLIFAFDFAGADTVLDSPVDAPLERALGMLPARLAELPNEIPGMVPEHAQMIGFAVEMISKPMRMAVVQNLENQAGGLMGYGVVASFGPMTRNEANEASARISAQMAQMGGAQFQLQPSRKHEHMSALSVPFGVVEFGPREAADGWRYEILAGSVGDPDGAFELMNSAGGVEMNETIASGELVLSGLTPFVSMGSMAMSQQMGEVPPGLNPFNLLQEAGLVGPEAVTIRFATGRTDDASATVTRAVGMKKFARGAFISSSPLLERHLNAIPADVDMAGMFRFDDSRLSELITRVRGAVPEIDGGVSQFEQMLGVGLTDDLLASFDGVMGFYNAEAIGGRGIMSSVLLLSLADEEKFGDVNTRLTSFFNEAVDQTPVGRYVQGAVWSRGGSRFYTLTFPGVPAPLELTYAIADGWLVLASTPQGAAVAVDHLMADGPGIMSNSAFRESMPDVRSPIGFSWIDSSKMIGDGYAITSLLCSAVANTVRSADGEREPGIVTPTYAAMAAATRPMSTVIGWDGDDLVAVQLSSESTLVNLAVQSGVQARFSMGGVTSLLPLLQGMRQGGMNPMMRGDPAWDGY